MEAGAAGGEEGMRKLQLAQVIATAPPAPPPFEKPGDKVMCPFGCRGMLVVLSLNEETAGRGRVEHTIPSCRFWNRYIKLTTIQREKIMALTNMEARRAAALRGR